MLKISNISILFFFLYFSNQLLSLDISVVEVDEAGQGQGDSLLQRLEQQEQQEMEAAATFVPFEFLFEDVGTQRFYDNAYQFCGQRYDNKASRDVCAQQLIEQAGKVAYAAFVEEEMPYAVKTPDYYVYAQSLRNENHVLKIPVGRATYGLNHLKYYWYGNVSCGVNIGKFVQIAGNVQMHLETERCPSRVAAYPFEEVFVEGKSATTCHSHQCKGTVTIGNDVWIANNVMIFSGVTVGDGAVLGAGAYVREDVPPYAIVIGNPSRIVGYRFEEEHIASLLRIKWWDFSDHELLDAIPYLVQDDITEFFQKYDKSNAVESS